MMKMSKLTKEQRQAILEEYNVKKEMISITHGRTCLAS